MGSADTVETDLVVRARAGDERALEALYRRHVGVAWRAALAITGDPGLADDAVQEAFVKAFGALSRFDVDRPFGPWMRRIAANAAVDRVRSHGIAEPLTEDGVAGAAWVEGLERRRDVIAALLRLPLEQRTAVVLRFWLDLPHADIAEVLGVPAGTVHSRLSRALERLRHELGVIDGRP